MRKLQNDSPLAWALWLCLVVAGLLGLATYDSLPGRSARAPGLWPAESSLPKPQGRPLLLSFIHPLCPCTRASLAELSRIQSAVGTRLNVTIVVGLPQGLEAGDTLARLRQMRGARVFLDQDLVESHRFGCYTSGQALLYSSQGRLSYQGGLTGSRGHEGDNAGKSALLQALKSDLPGFSSAPVYGCCLDKSKD